MGRVSPHPPHPRKHHHARTDLQPGPRPADLVGVLRLVCLRGLRALAVVAQAEHIRDDVARPRGAAAGLHAQRDLDVGLALRIGVVLRVLAEPLEDDEVVELDFARAHVLVDGREVLVDVLDNDLGRLARENLVEDVPV